MSVKENNEEYIKRRNKFKSEEHSKKEKELPE
jgi:hypothetical protein